MVSQGASQFQEKLGYQGARWASLCLSSPHTGDLSWRWATFQESSEKLPRKARAWRKTGNPQIQTNAGEKKNLIFFFVLFCFWTEKC